MNTSINILSLIGSRTPVAPLALARDVPSTGLTMTPEQLPLTARESEAKAVSPR